MWKIVYNFKNLRNLRKRLWSLFCRVERDGCYEEWGFWGLVVIEGSGYICLEVLVGGIMRICFFVLGLIVVSD